MNSLENFNITISGADCYINMYKELRRRRGIPSRGRLTQDNEDLLWLPRAAVVISISALDWYIHSAFKSCITIMIKNDRLNNNLYQELMNCFKFKDLKKFKMIYNTFQTKDNIIKFYYESKIRYSTYQDPAKIEKLFKVIDIGDIFTDIASRWHGPNRSSNDIKKELRKYVKRRDQIVHEGDMESHGNVRHMQPKYAKEVRDFVGTLVGRMDSVLIDWGQEIIDGFRP